MKIHEARINEDRHQARSTLGDEDGLVTRILATHLAWSALGIPSLVKGLETGQIKLMASDIKGDPNALHAWLSSYSSMMVRVLHDSWFQPLRDLAQGADPRSIDRLETLLEQAGCNPLARDRDGVDCIDLACLHGRYNSLRRWNSMGLDLAIDHRRLFLPSTPNGQWYGPLHLAAIAGSVEQMQALLDAGADPNLPDCQGRSPLFHVKDTNTANWLLAHGANPAHLDHQGVDARVYWQSGLWTSQKLDQLIGCLSRLPPSLTGTAAVPSFVALAYRQPATRLKSEMRRMKVGYDAVHAGRGLLGHAALRVIGHAGEPGSAATRWMELLLQQKDARNTINDIDLGLLCLIHRVGPDLTSPESGQAVDRVIDLARKSSRSLAECIEIAMAKYDKAAPTYLLQRAHYLEQFLADGSDACTAVVDRAFVCLATHHARNPPLGFRWFAEKLQEHPDNGAWQTSQALESLFVVAYELADKLAYTTPIAPVLSEVQQVFSSLLEKGARVDSIDVLHPLMASFSAKISRKEGEAEEIHQALTAIYTARVMSDAAPQATSSSAALRL